MSRFHGLQASQSTQTNILLMAGHQIKANYNSHFTTEVTHDHGRSHLIRENVFEIINGLKLTLKKHVPIYDQRYACKQHSTDRYADICRIKLVSLIFTGLAFDVLTLFVVIFLETCETMFIFSITSQNWSSASSWNISSWKTMPWQLCCWPSSSGIFGF